MHVHVLLKGPQKATLFTHPPQALQFITLSAVTSGCPTVLLPSGSH